MYTFTLKLINNKNSKPISEDFWGINFTKNKSFRRKINLKFA